MKIHFNNIFNQDEILFNDIIKNIKNIIKKGSFILGKDVFEFEKNFSKYTKSKYCISCANGTDALYLALKSIKLKSTDEVIVPAMTYIATASSVINVGAKLRLADINLDNGNINVEDLIKKINNKTKAIIVVSLWGNCADYKKILNISKKKNILLIEDAAQSVGAYDIKGNISGSVCDIGCFSFFPGKNLGAYGDAGAVVTNNKKIYEKILQLRTHGAKKKFEHNLIGINSRMDTIQASILNKKLKRIDKINNLKRKIAKNYFKKINNTKIKLLKINLNSSFHQFVVLTPKRLKFTSYLKKNKIPFGFHYPYAIHKLKAFKNLCVDKKLKNAEITSKMCVSLPIDPYLNKKQIEFIIRKINKY